MTKVTTAIALGILLLQAGLARAQCPTSGGNLAETRIDLNANDTTRTKTVRVEGMDAFPDCDSTVWIEYFTNGGSARGVGIGFSTLTREGDRKGRIAYADATGSRLHFRLRDESYIDGRDFNVELGVRVVGSAGGAGQLYTSPTMRVVVASNEPPEPPEPENRQAQGQLQILGPALEGSTLAADHTGIRDADGKPSSPSSYSYTWKYTDQSTQVSSAATIRLNSPRLGKRLQACVSFNDNRGGAEGPFCATSGKILNAPNGRWREPSIRHAGQSQDQSRPLAVVGNVLFAEDARITDPDGFDGVDPQDTFPRPNFNLQWVHVSTGGSSVLIPSATRQTYEVGVTDLGKHLAVEATYTDGLGIREAVVFVYRVPAKSPATGLQVRRIPADTWACGRRDSATIRIRSVPSGIRGMPAAFRSWSRRTLNCGRSGIAGSSEANIFRDNSTRRAGRVAGKRPRSPRTDRKDAAGVLDVRPAKPMVGKGAGHVRRRSMKRMQRRFRPRVRTAVGPST